MKKRVSPAHLRPSGSSWSKLNDFISNNSHVFKLVGFIVTVVTIFVAADGYIDTKIDRKITDTAYIGKISKQLRPFMIFDEKGVVQYDHGAEAKIKTIYVDFKQKIIEIETNEFMQLAPFIFTVGADNYSLKPERVGNRKWKYTMLYYEVLTSSGGSSETPETNYVLEILYSQ